MFDDEKKVELGDELGDELGEDEHKNYHENLKDSFLAQCELKKLELEARKKPKKYQPKEDDSDEDLDLALALSLSEIVSCPTETKTYIPFPTTLFSEPSNKHRIIVRDKLVCPDLDCPICCDNKVDVLLPCQHYVCSPCCSKTAFSCVSNSKSPQCPCCSVELSPDIFPSFLSDAELEKLEGALLKTALAKVSTLFCPRCSNTFEIPPDHDLPFIKCCCGISYCLRCKLKSHSGKCKEFSRVLKVVDGKQCPKCHTGIEKNEGCHHMTCKNCRYEFHWLTLQPWKRELDPIPELEPEEEFLQNWKKSIGAEFCK